MIYDFVANHCLHSGTCYVDRVGLPQCRCRTGYSGNQCEIVTNTCPGKGQRIFKAAAQF